MVKMLKLLNRCRQLKIKYFYKDTAEDVESRFDTSNFELDRPSFKGKKKKVIRLMKDELGEKIIKEIVGLNHEPNIDKIYLYSKDPHEVKYWLLINKRESTGIKYLNDSKGLIEYSNDMDDKSIEEYNINKKFGCIWWYDCRCA